MTSSLSHIIIALILYTIVQRTSHADYKHA